MIKYFTNISSRIDLYQSFINFFEPEFVKEVINIETEKTESEDDFIAPLKLAVVERYERDFRFHLNRYLYDLENLIRLSTPRTRLAIVKELEDEIFNYKEFSTNKEILDSVNEKNDFEIFLWKESSGEIGKKSSPRNEKDKLNLKKVNKKILNLYFDVIVYYVELHNRYVQNLIQLGIHKPNTYYDHSSVLQININKFIVKEKWERFIRICDFYSKERDYFGEYSNLKVIDYDDEKKQYTWLGIGDSYAPSIAKFIIKLEKEKIVKQNGEKKVAYILAFIIFFNMKSNNEFRKFIGKEMNNNRTKFDFIFNHISTIK